MLNKRTGNKEPTNGYLLQVTYYTCEPWQQWLCSIFLQGRKTHGLFDISNSEYLSFLTMENFNIKGALMQIWNSLYMFILI